MSSRWEKGSAGDHFACKDLLWKSFDRAQGHLLLGRGKSHSAVSGGGLTLIANAPNPAGYGLLKSHFGKLGISPLGLLLSALFPTFIVVLAYQFIPSL